jgi:hypothetical protein
MKTIITSVILGSLCVLFHSCAKDSTGDNGTTPSIKTVDVSDVIYTEAKVNVQITSDGGSTITEKGVCWSLNDNPSKTDHVVVSTSSETSFSCEITDLQINTSYKVRAYAVNEKGISYGEVLSFKTLDENSLPVSISPLIKVKWTVFTWPYNVYYPIFNGTNNVNGKLAAPCGPTTLSRTLAFWNGKIRGKGRIDATTTGTSLKFVVNLDTININYSNLPVKLSSSSTPAQYKEVAKIFLTAGAVGLTNFMDVATPDDRYINALKTYLNVSKDVRFAKRWDYSKEEWIILLKKELANKRPVMIAARKATSPKPWESGNVEGHWFNIEGYTSENKFYIDYNYDGVGFRGYYDVDDFGEYNSYGLAVVGFKPE